MRRPGGLTLFQKCLRFYINYSVKAPARRAARKNTKSPRKLKGDLPQLLKVPENPCPFLKMVAPVWYVY